MKYFYNGEDKWDTKYLGVNVSLYNIVKKLKPKKIVELGVGTGACTVHMCRALQEENIKGKILGFDTFADVDGEFRTKNKENVFREIKVRQLDPFVELQEGDIFHTWLENPTEFDMLWIDLNNTWEIVYDVVMHNEFITSQIKSGKPVYIEGGHHIHPRMNQATLDSFNASKGKDIFKFMYIGGNRISISKLELL
jgi:hypothetical protein